MEGKEITKKSEARTNAADVGAAVLLAPLLAFQGDERMRKGSDLFQKLYKKEFAHVWGALVARHLLYESSSVEGPHPFLRFKYTVQREHCSVTGFLSGGCVAALFDDAMTTALYMLGSGGEGGKPGGWFLTAVSRVLSVTYLRPCRLGDELHVKADIVQMGNALATTRASIRRLRDDALIATAEHQHFNSNAAAPKL